jgi:hypothetical protein
MPADASSAGGCRVRRREESAATPTSKEVVVKGALPPQDPYARPQGADDATVAALGKLSEALEYVERARGRLYDFHQLVGHADFLVGEAAEELAEAGHAGLADSLRDDIVGRNVLRGRWTFQIVDEFDDTYWSAVRDAERAARLALMAGRRHVHEAEMKERRRTPGRRHHESRPDEP